MSSMTRRAFLAVSSGVLGASVVGVPVGTRAASGQVPSPPRAKLYMVLHGTAPSKDDTDLEPISNEEIVRRLQAACDGVEFVVRDLTRAPRGSRCSARSRISRGKVSMG